jgi:hypothetical protein
MNDRNGEIQRRVRLPTRPTEFRRELEHFRAALKCQGGALRLSRASRIALGDLITAIAALLGEDPRL